MSSRVKVLSAIVAALFLFCAGALIAYVAITRLASFLPKTGFASTSTVLQQVQTLSQLVTVKYVMEKVVVYEDAKWYGQNRVILVANGIVKAGVDLGQLKPGDIEINGTRVIVHLPAERITDVYLDDNRTQILEHSTGILRTFDKDLQQVVRQQAVDDIRRAAKTSGILKDAKDRAQNQLRHFFLGGGATEVVFKSPLGDL